MIVDFVPRLRISASPPIISCPEPEYFLCRNTICIEGKKRCDGITHCQDGSDEADCPTTACSIDQFTCDDGKCLNLDLRCNQYPDCANGEDEISCCRSHEMKCGSGDCIDRSFRCNRQIDCPFDDADERGCEYSCSVDQFRCENGLCISASKRCDGRSDCPQDGSDEWNCLRACTDDEFMCADKSCIEKSWRCDQVSDCIDGSDEENCGCSVHEFDCGDRCISESLRCDSIYDCRDGRDEQNCPCPPNHFICRNGECISNERVCDRHQDCFDGSDEENCAKCASHEFQCSSGECIFSTQRCNNNRECQDGSDEIGCSVLPCREGEDRCVSGECIVGDKFCDGHYDCEDGSDERFCSTNTSYIETERPTADPEASLSSQCGPDQFECDNKQCIEKTKYCDGFFDCPDLSDEVNCIKPECLPDQFQCDSGDCIDSFLRCDNAYDCPDATDELDCPACDAYEFKCNSGECVSKGVVCDGRVDCSDYSDEQNCGDFDCSRNGDFKCGDGYCVSRYVVCDGHYDCRDQSDEIDCKSGCTSDEFTCDNGDCVSLAVKCDGHFDCFDNSDERDCIQPETTTRPPRPPQPSPRCQPYEFRCRNGDCVDGSYRCDGAYQCRDYSDEEGCPTPRPVTTTPRPCGPNEFTCRNGQCIVGARKCDGGYDCFDQSDEEDCPEPFICSNGQRISQRLRCDGRPDCYDGSDEQRCPHPTPEPPSPTDSLNLRTYPTSQTISQTREVVFQCRDEGPLRKPVRWVRAGGQRLPPGSTDVRGRLTMPNIQASHAGTYYCEAQEVPRHMPGQRVPVTLHVTPFPWQPEPPFVPVCGLNESTCRSGECIPRSAVCDGDNDCRDGSDETRCDPLGCEPNEFRCDNKQCIAKAWICDADDDCGDKSDERDCDELDSPDSFCRNYEFSCKNVSQCVPKSFHCDNEVDCQDESDEIGCTKPIISQPPPPSIRIDIRRNFTITCNAIGIPVPLIVWRFNWGHVPSSCTMTSERGFGVLTCVDSQAYHQGAYSCEAINTLGSVFAEPDAIVEVKTSDSVCSPPKFNAGAITPRDCLDCFCFGVSNECFSTGRYVTQRPPPSGPFHLVAVNQDQIQGNYVIGYPGYSISSQYLTPDPSTASVKVVVSDRQNLGVPSFVLIYFSLPDSHKGSQLTSYGGYLRYEIELGNIGTERIIQGPDIILRGNGLTIMYVHDRAFEPRRRNRVDVRFWPGNWYKKVTNNKGIYVEDPASRSEIMTVLGDIDLFLIRASYTDGHRLDTTLSRVQLDFAIFHTTNQGRAILVEECKCPREYTGISCEECAPNYRRVQTGTHLGQCILDVSCGPNEYGDPANGIPCLACPCPLTNPANQFSHSCYLGPDGDVICNCKPGYKGLHCETCADGYEGSPTQPGDQCRPVTCVRTFTCQDGSVHPWSRRCDGIKDCYGSEDERDCKVCFNSAHLCSDRICLNFDRICDGIEDCSDGSDEFRWNCIDKLPCDHLSQWTCADKSCIRDSQHCNGRRDCPDGSDEFYCNCHCEEPFRFKCANGQCVSGSSRCDGQRQCQDGSDERGCCNERYEFECGDGSCIDRRLYCNGLYNCRDGSDEPRSCPPICNPDYEIQCPNGKCVARSRLCDNIRDCDDGYDESPQSGCCHPVFQFKCRDGTCIRSSLVCNRYRDCPDGSDEFRCSDNCDPFGSYSLQPDPVTGLCHCMDHTTGPKCSRCKEGHFHLSDKNEFGCIQCFCMGITDNCTESNWYRNEVVVRFSTGTENVYLVDLDEDQERAIITNVFTDTGRRELVFNAFNDLLGPHKVYYWKLPPKFLGNKISAYGGNLTYTLQYVPSPGGQRSRNNACDVEIFGNDITLRYYSREELTPGALQTVTVPFYEHSWLRQGGQPTNREHFLMALADVEHILIKATYTTNTQEVSLKEVRMETAVNANTGKDRAYAVEMCECPVGYKGLSCEDCDRGYTRGQSGMHLGTCEPCDCNGYSEDCDPKTGICSNCKENRGGHYCETCAEGYHEDYVGECYTQEPCSCDGRGANSTHCEGDRCRCKANVQGDKCNICRDGHFFLSENNEEGCLKCWCSGVTNSCSSSRYSREQIPMNLFNGHGFTLSDRLRTSVVRDNLEVNLLENRISYNRFDTLSPYTTYYWSLPQIFTGNRLMSYGGKLSVTQSFDSRSTSDIYSDADVIISSADKREFIWMNPNMLKPRRQQNYTISLVESQFIVDQRPASREEFLAALANVEAILIRAQFSSSMVSTSLQYVTMDTAVDTHFGLAQQAFEVEHCSCPGGYIGFSCEECAQGYYRDFRSNLCVRCPCNGKEESCIGERDGSVRCNCLPGFFGPHCTSSGGAELPDVTFELTVSQPYYEADVGATIELVCSATTDRRVSIQWDRKDRPLPYGRSDDNYQGTLVISQARPEDSGIYICRASTGVRVKEEQTELIIRGGAPPTEPIVIIEEQTEETVEVNIGEVFEVRCRASGTPQPHIQWSRTDGRRLPATVIQQDGILTFRYAQAADSGEYRCSGRNTQGEASATITILVGDHRKPPVPDDDRYIIVQVSNSEVEERPGSVVRVVCSVPSSILRAAIEWTREQGELPQKSTQRDGELIIPDARPADSGLYTCHVTDSRGRTGKATTRINIVFYGDAPEVRIEPDNQNVNQGSSAQMRCIATGEPKPVITWSKANEILGPHVIIEGEVLRIERTDVTDRGLYLCEAENSVGKTRSSAILEVERREPPNIRIYPETKQITQRGSSAMFQCHLIGGTPTPQVTWERADGTPFTPNTATLDGGVLRFNEVTGDEEGSYICTAVNVVGKKTATATLEIHSMPAVTLNPSTTPLRVERGESFRLECTAHGDPMPSVVWEKLHADRQDALPGDSRALRNEAVYVVNSASMTDQGTYQCSATNEAGTTVERIQVLVRDYLPGSVSDPLVGPGTRPGTRPETRPGTRPETRPETRPPPPPLPYPDYRPTQPETESYQIPLGSDFILKCLAEDSEDRVTDDLSITFERSDGRPLPRGHTLHDGILTVVNVGKDAEGEYSCIVRERITNRVLLTTYSTLEVVEQPRVRLEPERQVVRPGDTVSLRCIVTGAQPITINWSKERGSMPSSVIINGGELLFKGIATTDTGRYVCEAINNVGTASSVAEVIVNERPLLTALQERMVVSQGQTVDLRCETSGLNPATVRWSLEGRNALPRNAYPFSSEGILRITNVQPENEGHYKCEARTDFGGYTYDFIELVVRSSTGANIQIRPSSSDVNVGDPVELYCDVIGEQRASVVWSRDRLPLPYNARADGRSLQISNVQPNDVGVYICTVMTSAGVFEETYPLTLQAPEYNSLGVRSVETMSSQFGSTVVIKCGIDMAPPLSYTWSKQGDKLPIRARITDDVIEIPEVQAQDAGTYVCTARNDVESIDASTLLIVTGVVPQFSGDSYIALPTLKDAYLVFDLEISFKPKSDSGLILYNSQRHGPGDFVAFGMNDGFAEFLYDVGSGPAVLRSRDRLNLGDWHTVKLSRNRKNGTMIVDDGVPVTGTSDGKYIGLDLLNPLYIGGVPEISAISEHAGFTTNFEGCISRLVIGAIISEIMRDARSQHGVQPCDTCHNNPCKNGGVCQEAYSSKGHKCICPAGYSGEACESTGESCEAGVCGSGRCVNIPGGLECFCPFGKTGPRCEKTIEINEPAFSRGAYMAYPTPKAIKRFSIGMKVKPETLEDGIIMYCGQQESGEGDFTSLALRDTRLEFKFNTGTGTATLMSDPVHAGEWIKVHANRTNNYGSLRINDGHLQNGQSLGSSRSLNLRTPLFLGGVDRSKIEVPSDVRVTQGFTGCVSEVELMDLPVNIADSHIESSNVDQCGVSLCSRDPCLNGGVCTDDPAASSGFVCSCPEGFHGPRCGSQEGGVCVNSKPCLNAGVCQEVGNGGDYCLCSLGYGGPNCQYESLPKESARFSQHSWLEIDRYRLPQDGISDQEVTIEFSTLHPDGLLFWLGQEPSVFGGDKDYLSLGIVNGFVAFSFRMDHEVVTGLSTRPVNDGERHTVVFRKSKNTGTLQVDDQPPVYKSTSDNLFSFITNGNIYIGGAPDLHRMTGSKYASGFTGCIHRLKIGSNEIENFMDYALQGINVSPCTSGRRR